MKTKLRGVTVVFSLLLLSSAAMAGSNAVPLEGKIGLSGAWALYPMAVKWGEEFRKIHPGVKLDISAGGAGKGMTDALSGAVDIGMVSRDIAPAEMDKGALPLAVARDAVVAVTSSGNPFLRDIMKKGVSREVLTALWSAGAPTWALVTGDASVKLPVHSYTRSDACGAAETWAAYLDMKQENLKGIGVYGDPGIGDAVRRERLAVGYNNVGFAYEAATDKPVPGIVALPIDINGNGTLDPEEDFYATRSELLKAIAEGRYPSPPARDLFFVTKGKPTNPLVVEFLRWVLTDGQKLVGETGFVPLTKEKLDASIGQLQ